MNNANKRVKHLHSIDLYMIYDYMIHILYPKEWLEIILNYIFLDTNTD